MAGFHVDVPGFAGRLWGIASSAPVRVGLFALFVAAILAYGAAYAWHMLHGLHVVDLIRYGYRDDAFYYLQLAYHMAEGRFSTFDGGLTRTNGYHPLWLFLITPFYWVFDKTEALFAVKAFEIMLVALGVALLAGAARAARLPWILLFAALPALYAGPAFGGMESAAVVLALGAFVLGLCLCARDPARWRWLLAAVAFALPWARLETAAVAVAGTAALFAVERITPPLPVLRGSAGPDSQASRSLDAAAPLLGALAGLLAYFAYNGAVFGGVAPVSGVVKALWSERAWEYEGGYSVLGNFRDLVAGNVVAGRTVSPQLNVFDDELWIALEVCVYALLVWWLSARSRSREDWLLLAFMIGVFALAAGHLAKFAQSVLTMHPRWAYESWYFVPAYLVDVLVVPARCCAAICVVRRFVRAKLASVLLRSGIVAAGLTALAAKADFAAPFRLVDEQTSSQEMTVRSWAVASYAGTLAMNRLLPRESVVGSWGSGIAGYFSRSAVVNLDGLANSYDYARMLDTGTLEAAHDRLGLRFTHFASLYPRAPGSRPTPFRLQFPRPHLPVSPLLNDWIYPVMPCVERPRRPGDACGTFVFNIGTVWPGAGGGEVADQAGHSAWFWQSVESLRQADGTALVREGRVALAFRPDCAAGEIAAWSWDSSGVRYASPWARTAIGVCASAIVLPRPLPRVQVETTTVGEYLAELRADASAAFNGDFDMILVDRLLLFMKDACTQGDTEAPFYLHIVPVDEDDLPEHRRQHGYDNLDFKFADRGHWLNGRGGRCVAEVPLPNYPVAAVRAGQYLVEGEALRNIWEGKLRLEPLYGTPELSGDAGDHPSISASPSQMLRRRSSSPSRTWTY